MPLLPSCVRDLCGLRARVLRDATGTRRPFNHNAGEERWISPEWVRSLPTKGPADWFTGTVRIDPLFQAKAPARAAGASVTFEPGARTAWHTHPLGQTLIITAGCGWVQQEGGPVEEVRPGDVVWFPPGVKHWHGATPDHGDDAHRHSGGPRRQDGRLAGARQRRAIPQVTSRLGPVKHKDSMKAGATVRRADLSR